MRSICDLLIAGMSSPSLKHALKPAVSDSKQRSHHAQFQFETKTAICSQFFFNFNLTHVQMSPPGSTNVVRTQKQRSK